MYLMCFVMQFQSSSVANRARHVQYIVSAVMSSWKINDLKKNNI